MPSPWEMGTERTSPTWHELVKGVDVVSTREIHPLAPELQMVVAHQDAGEQTGFAEDLKAVADPDDESACVGKLLDGLHDWGESRYRSGPEIVTVRESAWHNQAVNVGDVGVLMPDVASLLSEVIGDGGVAIDVAPSTGENDDPEVHRGTSAVMYTARVLADAVLISLAGSP